MALSVDVTSTGIASTTSAVTTGNFSGAITAGDILVACITAEWPASTGVAGTVNSVTDTAGLTWTRRSGKPYRSFTTSYAVVEVWWAYAPAGAASTDHITAAFSLPASHNFDDAAITVVAFKGFTGTTYGTNPWDANPSLPAYSANTTGTSTVPTISGVSTSSSDTAILDIVAAYTGSWSASPTSGFTAAAGVTNAAGSYVALVGLAYKVVGAPQSGLSFGFTFGNQSWSLIADALSMTGGGTIVAEPGSLPLTTSWTGVGVTLKETAGFLPLTTSWGAGGAALVAEGGPPSPSVNYYLAKVPPLHAGDARFMAELSLVLQPFVDAQALIASLPSLFDLDNAIGVQLDATGAWIGQSRQIPVPVMNPWFSFGAPGLGFSQGYWKGPYEGVGLASLDDDTYRRLLRAVVLANNCDGTQPKIQAALSEYFVDTDTRIFALDATDYPPSSWPAANLRMVIGVSGKLPTIVDLSILAQGLIPIQPAAVELDWAVTTVSGSPVFGFGVDNDFIGGFGRSAWSQSPDWVIDNVITA